MNSAELLKYFEESEWNQTLTRLYGASAVAEQHTRYLGLTEAFQKRFGETDTGIRIFSSPGRTEIGGNHTDHNLGKVLTGSIDLDSIAVAVTTDDGMITVHDLKYDEDFSVSLEDTQKRPGERGAISLVRGILKGFADRGLKLGGFKACVTSTVISAAGVSSSASFEMLICAMMDYFYNGGEVPKTVCAQIGQYAENTYWDKQSGLLDQTACAVGGLVAIDFENPAQPKIRKLEQDFSDYGYGLVIVNTGGNHADLSSEYSSIPMEMKSVAAFFGKTACREISMEELLANAGKVREVAGDRAVLRALHFLEENDRVDREVAALDRKDFPEFLRLVTESGNSSWKWLQNCYCPGADREQEIPYALALTDLFITRKNLVAGHRVHGGGFAGVIMAILPEASIEEYMEYMRVAGMVPFRMNVRKQGAVALL